MPPRREIKDYIRTIVDFPHEGIMFRDVTTLFVDPRGFRMAIDQLLLPYAGVRFDKVVGLEARGFILGGAVAHQLSAGFVPVRKKGKLPGAVISEEYQLEYGEAVVEVHDDAIEAGEKILIVDDLLATGGTAEAGIKLVERLGGEIIGCAFIVDLPDLGGELHGIEGFHDHVERAQAAVMGHFAGLDLGRHEGYRHLTDIHQFAQPLQRLRAVHARHHHVQQDQLRREAVGGGNTGGAGIAAAHGEAANDFQGDAGDLPVEIEIGP